MMSVQVLLTPLHGHNAVKLNGLPSIYGVYADIVLTTRKNFVKITGDGILSAGFLKIVENK